MDVRPAGYSLSSGLNTMDRLMLPLLDALSTGILSTLVEIGFGRFMWGGKRLRFDMYATRCKLLLFNPPCMFSSMSRWLQMVALKGRLQTFYYLEGLWQTTQIPSSGVLVAMIHVCGGWVGSHLGVLDVSQGIKQGN